MGDKRWTLKGVRVSSGYPLKIYNGFCVGAYVVYIAKSL
jgi:hypothetical protein